MYEGSIINEMNWMDNMLILMIWKLNELKIFLLLHLYLGYVVLIEYGEKHFYFIFISRT